MTKAEAALVLELVIMLRSEYRITAQRALNWRRYLEKNTHS